MPSPRLPDLPTIARVARAGALAGGAVLASTALAQPPQFSGATCSMNNCDCNCIDGEEQKGEAAIESLRIEVRPPLITAPTLMTPGAALTHLQRQRWHGGLLLLMLDMSAQNPGLARDTQKAWNDFSRSLGEYQLPPVPAGWTPKQYLDTMMAAGRPVIKLAAQAVDDEKAVRREITDCRRFADLKRCDPSLGTAGESPATAPAPPRESTPAPPVVTPPRQMWPPDQPQPFARHPDGRPIVDDELITRYIAAKRAHDQQGGAGAYWREGGFGQADYAEVHARFDLWARTAGTPDRQRLFEQNELDACQHREKELREALTGVW